MGLLEVFLENKTNRKKSDWVIGDINVSLTRSEIIDLVEKKFNSSLKKYGLKKGDIVFVRNPQTCRFLPFILWAFRCGMIVTPLYERSSDCEVSALFNRLKPKGIFDFKTESFEINPSPHESLIDEPGMVFQTSGTTGDPQLIFQSERNLFLNAEKSIQRQNISRDSICYSTLTVSHTGGLNMQVLPTLISGGRVFLDSSFYPNGYIKNMRTLGVTHCVLVPSHYRILKKQKILSGLSHSKTQPVLLTGSEPVPNQFFPDIKNLGGLPLAVYGLTEAGPFLCFNREERYLPPGTISVLGKFENGCRARVNSQSLIEVSGPVLNHFLIQEKGRVSIKKVSDRWFETGDSGLEEDGFFFFSGRGDHQINMGGYKFSLYEVEEFLNQLSFIQACRVFKVKDPLWHERAEADVEVARPGVTPQQIKKELRKTLNPLKIPRKINIVESIKKTSLNKVKRGIWLE